MESPDAAKPMIVCLRPAEIAQELGDMQAWVQGIQDLGVDVVIKHFALNDCEQDRLGQAAWVGEQAAREIYLKAFQKALEECGGNGVMTAYTRWGARWSGSHYGLMTGIMRGEWGNMNMSITDNVLVNYCNGVDAIMAGGVTTFDAMLPYITNQLPNFENDPVVVAAMREAVHHNLYALANSSGMNGVGANTTITPRTPIVLTTCMILACAGAFFSLVGIVLWTIGGRKLKKSEQYTAYKTAKAKYKASK
jgi:beta-glucosidase